MALLFEGTLQLDGRAVPARLTLDIDRRELARLLDRLAINDDAGSPRRAWRGLTADTAKNGDTGASPQTAIPAPSKRGSAFEPIEIRPHPGRRITFEMLEWITDPAKRWAALAERFPWADFKVPAGTPELTAGDLVGIDESSEADELSQLDQDWLTIEPHLDDLVSDEGRPVRGYQSRIAEYLGGTNDGHFRRARVEPLVTRFKAWLTEEWVYTSSTSAPDEEEDESAESPPGAARVA